MNKPWSRSVLFIFGLGLVLIGIRLFYLVKENSSLNQLSGRMATFSHSNIINSLDRISQETIPGNLIGASVALRSVPVTAVYGNYLFIAGKDEEKIPVVLLGEITGRQSDEKVRIKKDHQVRIIGTLYALRDIASITDPDFMTNQEIKKISQSKVFILADRVVIDPRATSQ